MIHERPCICNEEENAVRGNALDIEGKRAGPRPVPPINPDTAAPMWKSTSMIFSTDDGSNSVDVSLFSTARMMPALVWIPTAVDPSLTASIAYSTWNNRPSGENVFTPRSYSLLVRYMLQSYPLMVDPFPSVQPVEESGEWGVGRGGGTDNGRLGGTSLLLRSLSY